jgi:hypothetical protein
MNRLILIGLFGSVALLSACGGGGGGADATPAAPSPLDAVSAEASQSAAGLKRYISAMTAMPAEDREPVDLRTFSPPAGDDSEPETLG